MLWFPRRLLWVFLLVSDVEVPYRFAQFWWAITARALPEPAQHKVESILSTSEWELFQRFSPGDQRHGYQVYRTLCAAGHVQTDLLVAGILHDIGKTRVHLSVWDRILVVIGEALFPQEVSGWGKEIARGWKRPFVVRAQHAEWGAEMAEAAGSSAIVVDLIRHHQDSLPTNQIGVGDELLHLLQWADNQN